MSQHLYISDLDGTLFQPDASLSFDSREGLNKLLESPDFQFTIATARGFHSTKQKLAGLNLRLPVILNNGAYISDLVSGKHLVINSIPDNLIKDVYQLIRFHARYPMISSNDGKRDNLYCHAELNDGIRWFHGECKQIKDSRLREAHYYEQGLNERITGLVVIDKLPIIQEIHASLTQQFSDSLSFHYYENIYSKGWYWLEISSQIANKSSAIQQFCKLYNYDVKTLTTFGDNLNDISMLKLAQHKIAVGNAVEPLKKIATEVIGRNTEEAVVGYIKRKFKLHIV